MDALGRRFTQMQESLQERATTVAVNPLIETVKKDVKSTRENYSTQEKWVATQADETHTAVQQPQGFNGGCAATSVQTDICVL